MPNPGDIGLTKIRGFAGKFVFLGQWFVGDLSPWTHAFILLDDDTVIEAMPGGARITPLSDYEGREILWSEFPLADEQRLRIVAEARSLEGTPYSFADYVALFLERVGFRFGIVKRYVTSSGHMICSQLCDEVYRRCGIHLFDDGRMPQDVTPGDLHRVFRKQVI